MAFQMLILGLLFSFFSHNEAVSSCNITYPLDYGTPIYTVNGEFLHDHNGNIEVPVDAVIVVSCPGHGNGILLAPLDYPLQIGFICGDDYMLKHNGIRINLMEFVCSTIPECKVNVVGTCLSGNQTQVTISATIPGGENTVLATACLSKANSRTSYIQYYITKNEIHFNDPPKMLYSQGSLYPNLQMNKLYELENQKRAIDAVLGCNRWVDYHIDTNMFVVGDLISKYDYVFAWQQAATYNYVNTAPMWKSVNEGNWKAFDTLFKTYVDELQISQMMVTSGSFFDLELTDRKGKKKPIYLDAPLETKTSLPVPRWFYKIYQINGTNEATAFLTLNNPNVTLEEAVAMGDSVCPNICKDSDSGFEWMDDDSNWNPRSVGAGYSICCNVDDLRKSVDIIPDFEVSGPLPPIYYQTSPDTTITDTTAPN